MSDASAFIERIQTDAALRQQVQQANLDALVGLAAKHGYRFTAEEYLAAAKAYAEANRLDEAQLSEEDLMQVAGGWKRCRGLPRSHRGG